MTDSSKIFSTENVNILSFTQLLESEQIKYYQFLKKLVKMKMNYKLLKIMKPNCQMMTQNYQTMKYH